MKNIVIKSLSLLILLTALLSCSDLTEEYYENPDETTQAEVGKLFSHMVYNDYIKPTYWNYATFVTGVTAKYSQIIGITVSTDMYTPSASYNQDRWRGFYVNGIMNTYRAMEKTYAELDEAKQSEQAIFLKLGKIILLDQACQLVDLWGDIPFTEAGGLVTTNKMSNARFDTGEEIYATAISELDEINTYLSTVSMSTSTIASLQKQDFLLQGNVNLWRKYANSLRLRLLMRISNSDESTAQSQITAMLNNSDTYPLINDNSENILLQVNPPDFNSEGLRAGLTDGATSSGAIAPKALLEDVMVDNNDPRVVVYWDPGSDSVTWSDQTYRGLVPDTVSAVASAMWTEGLLATYDSATFILNWNCPGVLFTASEVSFLKAEANERWSVGDDAQSEYESGIRNSIEFYYSLNQSSYLNPNSGFSREALISPEESEIEAFLTSSDYAYTGSSEEKLAKIYTQKWVDYFILQAGQAWAEIRRTGYPALTFAEDPSYGYLPPVRLLYPDTEKSNNANNYAAVSGQDTRSTKVFWDVNQ
jgi:hypothetical protein